MINLCPIWKKNVSFLTSTLAFKRDIPLHQEPGQKPGQPGKGWPGQAFQFLAMVQKALKGTLEQFRESATCSRDSSPWMAMAVQWNEFYFPIDKFHYI